MTQALVLILAVLAFSAHAAKEEPEHLKAVIEQHNASRATARAF